jgi:hypothetical protein
MYLKYLLHCFHLVPIFLVKGICFAFSLKIYQSLPLFLFSLFGSHERSLSSRQEHLKVKLALALAELEEVAHLASLA